MKALVFRSYAGTPELVEQPTPTPKPGEVLVRVRATSINPIDWKQVSGKFRPILTASFPFIPSYDLAGEVEALGDGVTTFTKGQHVHTRLSGRNGGANAELVAAGLDVLRPMPEGMSFAQAAGLPLAGMTALQGLRDECRVPMEGAKERVLVVGASGGVGHVAVQLAKASGAHVTGVCSTRNVELVRRLGADVVIDYTKPDAWQGVQPFDVVFDCVGSAMSDHLAKLVPNGRFASSAPGPSTLLRQAANVFTGKKVAAVMLKPNAADLGVLDALFEKKKLDVVIDSTFPVEKFAEAFARSESGRAAGKIIVTWS